jgi:hypothetical protein
MKQVFEVFGLADVITKKPLAGLFFALLFIAASGWFFAFERGKIIERKDAVIEAKNAYIEQKNAQLLETVVAYSEKIDNINIDYRREMTRIGGLEDLTSRQIQGLRGVENTLKNIQK